MSNRPKIGWIGLGKMGIPMSTNLLKAGFPVTVYNRTVSKTENLVNRGANVAESPQALAADSAVIISMISDDQALEAVSLAVFQTARSRLIYIDMSTVSPAASARVAHAAKGKGIRYLRAPVSGSTVFADTATLTIFVSGDEDAYHSCVEIFDTVGKKSFHVGRSEEARYIKLVLNMMVGLTSGIVAEALTFGERGGMDWEMMIDIINNSVVASPLVGYKTQMLKERNFAPAFTASQMAKDFDIALDTGRKNNVPMPMTAIMRQFLGTMLAKGDGEKDYFGYVALIEELAGTN